MQDYYGILGVSKAASREEIQKAFRRLAREHHPDVTGQADSDDFRRIHEAYEVLSDPERRAAYDAEQQGGIPIAVHRGGYSQAPSNPAGNRPVEEVFRTSGRRGNSVHEVDRTPFSRASSADDLFDSLDELFFSLFRGWWR